MSGLVLTAIAFRNALTIEVMNPNDAFVVFVAAGLVKVRTRRFLGDIEVSIDRTGQSVQTAGCSTRPVPQVAIADLSLECSAQLLPLANESRILFVMLTDWIEAGLGTVLLQDETAGRRLSGWAAV